MQVFVFIYGKKHRVADGREARQTSPTGKSAKEWVYLLASASFTNALRTRKKPRDH